MTETNPQAKPPAKQARFGRKTKLFITLPVLAAAAACAGYALYRNSLPQEYEYWRNLLAKDPKPLFVSEEEYRAKNRGGYCWRDKKYYTAEELKDKAVVSFGEKLLSEVEVLKSRNVPDGQGGSGFFNSVETCKRSETGCRVWFLPHSYTNEQWDKFFLSSTIKSTGKEYLTESKAKEIQSPKNFASYIQLNNKNGFSLIQDFEGGQTIYGSNCCSVLPATQMQGGFKTAKLVTAAHPLLLYHQGELPRNINIQDYGVGNFYLKTSELSTWTKEKGEIIQKDGTYQQPFDSMYLINNCGDVLWHPHLSIHIERN